MEFTPGEKAVLSQIRVLYAASSRTEQQMKALTMQWAPNHFESYRTAFGGLIEKRLIDDLGSQIFRITDAGLRAIGVTLPRPQPVVPRAAAARPEPLPAPAPRARRGLLGRFFRGRA